MPTLSNLNHAYNRGYGDARQCRTALPVAWDGDELEQYTQGYEEGPKLKALNQNETLKNHISSQPCPSSAPTALTKT